MENGLNKLFKKTKVLVVEEQFDKQLTVGVEFMSNRAHMALLDDTKEVSFSKGLKAAENLNNDVYWRGISLKVKSWTMTFRMLQEYTDVDLPPEIDLDSPVKCTPENVYECMHEIKGFSGFLVSTITERIKYKKQQVEGEVGNSETSPGNE